VALIFIVNFRLSSLLVTCLCFSWSFAFSQEKDEPSSVKEAVEQLTDDSYIKREEATHYLWEQGRAIIDELNAYLENDEPEVSVRVRKVIRNIRLGILPDTPKDVIALVERYQRGGNNEKRDVFNQLASKKAYRQLLYLYELEESLEVRQDLSSIATRVAILEARQLLMEGEDEEALTYLLLAPAESDGMRAAADYYRQKGKLDEQIKLAKKSESANSKRWLLTLLRAKGDLPAAIQLADEIGDIIVSSALRAVQGDPVPFLQQAQEGLVASPWMTWHMEITESLWTGDPHTVQLSKIINELKTTGDVETKKLIASSLFLNGYPEKGLELFSEWSPNLLFDYYESIEHLDLALAVFGISSREEVIEKVEERLKIKKGEESPRFGDDNTLDVFLEFVIPIASLYESRGDRVMARAILDRPISLLLEKNRDNWIQLLIGMIENRHLGCGELSILYAKEGSVDKEKYPVDLIRKLSMTADVGELKSLLDEVKPDWGLHEFLVMLGYLPDRGNVVEELEAEMLRVIKKRKPLGVKRGLRSLISAASVRRSYLKALRWYDELNAAATIEKIPAWYQTVSLYSKQWGKMSGVYKLLYEANPENPVVIAGYGALLKRLGEKKKGDELIEQAERLSLGAPNTLMGIAQNMKAFGEEEKAYEIYERVLMTGDSRSAIWKRQCAVIMSDRSFKQGDYVRAASLLEVFCQNALEGFRFATVESSLVREYQSLRGKVYFYRGMAALEAGDSALGLERLKKSHGLLGGLGFVADEMFPTIRNKIPKKEYLELFEKDSGVLLKVMGEYPNSANVHNSYAWLCSRAMVDLEKAEKAINKSLSLFPNQAPYLDTKAEVEFAQKRRKSAVEWSDKAVEVMSSDSLIWEQNNRFKKGGFPELLK